MTGIPLINNKSQDIILIDIPTPFPVGSVNVYLLVSEKVTLIDTGPKTNLAWKSLVYQLNLHGFRLKDIDQVVITHHHVDHSGLLSIMKEHNPNLTIIAHQASVPWLEKSQSVIDDTMKFYKKLYVENGLPDDKLHLIGSYNDYFNQYTDPIKVDKVIEKEMKLIGNDEWEIVHSPGHSQGHISLYNQKLNTLISGDHVIGHLYSGSFIEPPLGKNLERPKSLLDYKHSLERMRLMNLTRVFAGHGEEIINPNSIIDAQLNRIVQRTEQMKSLLETSSLTAFDIIQKNYPNKYEKRLPLVFSEVLGVLDLLETEGKISSVNENGLIRYKLA